MSQLWIYTAILSILLMMTGCVNQEQVHWRDTQAWIAIAVDVIATEYENHLFDSVQLELLLGKPDFRGTVSQLSELLERETYQDRIMSRLYAAFARYGTDKSSSTKLALDQWSEAQDFLACEIWIYDESAHFTQPLSEPFAAKTGFSASVYYFKGDKVIGSCPFVYWAPLP